MSDIKSVGKGLIYKIEKGAVHDGPGIRTVIFLKGCPLRCKWCSSPQSWNLSVEISFSSRSCIKCGECFKVCPEGAIVPDGNEYLRLDRRACTNCEKCCPVCTPRALKAVGQYMTEAEVFSIIAQDILFYRNSNGGVTLSGGEPTMQPEFSRRLLQQCREQNISAAMESCLYARWENLAELVEYLDLIYIDIKCIDSKKHEELTGKPNELILDNAIKLNRCRIPIIVRIPVIPGYTSDEENIRAIAEFVIGLTHVSRIELLPYHRLGITEYKWLGRDYQLEHLEPPSNESLLELKRIVESYGLVAQIGG